MAFLVLAILVVNVNQTPDLANKPDAERQLAQAAVGSPENPANKSKSAGSTCVKEIDEEWRTICKRKSQTESARQKRPVLYVMQKKILDETGKRCGYQCVLKEQNSGCQEKEKTYFEDSKGNVCWACGKDPQTVNCGRTAEQTSEESIDAEAQIKAQETLRELEQKAASGEYLNPAEIEARRQAREVLGLNRGNNLNELLGEHDSIKLSFLDDPNTPALVEDGTIPQGALAFHSADQSGQLGQLDNVPAQAGRSQDTSNAVSPRAPAARPAPAAPQSVGTARPASRPSGPLARADAGNPSVFGPSPSQQGFRNGPGQRVGSGYRSLQPFMPSRNAPQNIETGGGLGDVVRGFLGNTTPTYETPQGQFYENPVVAYAPVSGGIVFTEPTPHLRSIREIASDVAAETRSADLPRVDHFAQTLSRVGGPNTRATINTENASFGRIQDLIVEDEAIRALRVAEEAGSRARNAVFCRPGESSDDCQTRRIAKAEEVERETFIDELEGRYIPQPALEHFLAVYDGWVRPSPAPRTRATSTLGALLTQEQDPHAAYERETSGNTFVWWIIENVREATRRVVDTTASLFSGSR